MYSAYTSSSETDPLIPPNIEDASTRAAYFVIYLHRVPDLCYVNHAMSAMFS